MARHNPLGDVSAIFAAARVWVETCMVDDGSLFSAESLWTLNVIDDLRSAFVEQPDVGDASFYDKLERQMIQARPEARRLMAEMLWVVMLFQRKMSMSPQTKRKAIGDAWSWGGSALDSSHPFLSDEGLSGIGHPGQGYNAFRWKELGYLSEVARSFKMLERERRRALAVDPWGFGEWLESVEMDGRRQFRHVLCCLMFPDEYERIGVAQEKAEILVWLAGCRRLDVRRFSDVEVDKRLAELRARLAAERGSNQFDFYDADLAIRWKPQSGAWLLSWNSNVWAWETFDADRDETASGRLVRMEWRCAIGRRSRLHRRRQMEAGRARRRALARRPLSDVRLCAALPMPGRRIALSRSERLEGDPRDGSQNGSGRRPHMDAELGSPPSRAGGRRIPKDACGGARTARGIVSP